MNKNEATRSERLMALAQRARTYPARMKPWDAECGCYSRYFNARAERFALAALACM